MKKCINTILKIAVVFDFRFIFLNVRMRILIVPCKFFDYSFAAWSNEILIIVFFNLQASFCFFFFSIRLNFLKGHGEELL